MNARGTAVDEGNRELGSRGRCLVLMLVLCRTPRQAAGGGRGGKLDSRVSRPPMGESKIDGRAGESKTSGSALMTRDEEVPG